MIVVQKAQRPEFTVAVILVNYNTLNDTIECVKSIANSSIKPFVVLVDNNSNEKPQPLQFQFYESFTIINNPENLGFGCGNNIGINWVLNNLNTDYIFLLNNDTIIQPDTIENLIRAFEVDHQIGLTTCKIVYSYNPELIWYGGGDINLKRGRLKIADFNDIATEGGANKNRFVTFASGCAMMFKTGILKDLEGFDEKLFMYVEDLELSIRLQKLGYRIWYTSATFILHKVHGSSNTTAKKLPAMHPDNPRLAFYAYLMIKNMLLTMYKHLSGFQWFRFLVNYLAFISYKDFTYLMRGRFDGIRASLKAISDFNKEK